MRRLLLAVTSLLIGGLALWLLYYLVGPEIDNRVGVLISRDIRFLQDSRVGDTSLLERLQRQYNELSWSGSHREEIWRTFIECRARDAGGREVRFYWEVSRGYSPAEQRERAGVFVYALTSNTAILTPEFIPRGLTAVDLPTTPSMTATALHGLARRTTDPH